MQTLVLDKYYRPHRVTSWLRATHLLLANKVDVLENYNAEIRPGMPMPAVVRLSCTIPNYMKSIRFTRANVWLRDKYTCQYCGKHCRASQLTYDHVVPRFYGGKTEWSNITSACHRCNNRKANRTPEEAGMKLLSVPQKPQYLPLKATLNLDTIPEQWTYWI